MPLGPTTTGKRVIAMRQRVRPPPRCVTLSRIVERKFPTNIRVQGSRSTFIRCAQRIHLKWVQSDSVCQRALPVQAGFSHESCLVEGSRSDSHMRPDSYLRDMVSLALVRRIERECTLCTVLRLHNG